MIVRGHELKNVQVKRLSLVDRGAIRAPFKIQKRDVAQEGAAMNIFKKLFKSTEPVKPSVIAIATAKSADQEAVKARVLKAGFIVTDMVETEDAVIYRQPGAPAEIEGIVVKFDDDVCAVISGVRKEFAPWSAESSTFGDLMAMAGVYPSVSTAMEVLTSKVWDAITQAADPATAATEVAKAFDDAKVYLTAVTGDLPSNAFKMDQFLQKSGKLGVASDASDDDTNGDGASGNGDGDGIPKKPKKETADTSTGIASDAETTNNSGKAKTSGKDTLQADPTGIAAPSTSTNGNKATATKSDMKGGPIDTAFAADTLLTVGDTKTDGVIQDPSGSAAGTEPSLAKKGVSAEQAQEDDDNDEAGEDDGVDTKKPKMAEKKKAEDDEVTTLLKGLVTAVKGIGDRLSAVEENVEDVTGQIKKAEGETTKLKGVLKSALPGARAEGDREVAPRKSNGGYQGGLIDTALAPLED